jgi:hypothetical protein
MVKEGEYGTNTVHTCTDRKMVSVETILGMGGVGDKEWWRG